MLQFFQFPLNGLQKECNVCTLQMTISQLEAELEKGPQEAAVYTQQIHQLQSNLNNLQQQSQVRHTPQLFTYDPDMKQITAGANTFAEVSVTHCSAYDLLLLQWC